MLQKLSKNVTAQIHRGKGNGCAQEYTRRCFRFSGSSVIGVLAFNKNTF
jgi:hypothetical protein